MDYVFALERPRAHFLHSTRLANSAAIRRSISSTAVTFLVFLMS